MSNGPQERPAASGRGAATQVVSPSPTLGAEIADKTSNRRGGEGSPTDTAPHTLDTGPPPRKPRGGRAKLPTSADFSQDNVALSTMETVTAVTGTAETGTAGTGTEETQETGREETAETGTAEA